MGILSNFLIKGYKNGVVCRYDKDPAIPYYSYKDFPGLNYEKNIFTNSVGRKIAYFYYSYDNFIKDKIAIFLPGIGPGHTAYLKEINELCSAGFKVLTIDYTGCSESEGERLFTLNAPTRDVDDLLKYLKLKEEILLVGHSLGAYTALNILNTHDEIKTGVIISAFISLYYQFKTLLKSGFLAKKVCNYEREVEPTYYEIDNLAYLKDTKDNIFFVHSKDDTMVGYKYSVELVERLENPNLEFFITDKKRHNPTYTYEAVQYLTKTFSEYRKLIKDKKLDTVEKRKEFFQDKSIDKMTEMDKDVINKIIDFLKK